MYMKRRPLNKKQKHGIVNFYKNNHTIIEISNILDIPWHTVRRTLIREKIDVRNCSDYKWKPTKFECDEIINLYTIDKRGIQYISQKLNTHWNNIRDFLIEKKIKLWDKSTLIKSNINHYGQSSGMLGKKHSKLTRRKMSVSRIGNVNNVTGPKCQFISTVIGKVQGSYEVAYLQQCLNRGLTLPSKCGKVKTPYGSYFPAFEYDDHFIEVKSPFTWDICQGKQPNGKGIKTDVQFKKIKWTRKNVKNVDVVIIDNKKALKLFLQAINNKNLVMEEILYKNGKYYKKELLHLP